MSAWPSTRARRVLAALLRIGWAVKRQSGSPVFTLAVAGCAAVPPSTPAGNADLVERNKALVRELTEVVWNQRGLDRIPEFYGPDFVGDYRPYALRQGHEGIGASVAEAWTAFPDYHEEILALIGEGDRVVVHLAISGTQRGQWGALPPTGSSPDS